MGEAPLLRKIEKLSIPDYNQPNFFAAKTSRKATTKNVASHG